MTLPSEVLRSQARFDRGLMKTGLSLTLSYAGPWTRSPATGAVSRAVTTAQARGRIDFGGVSSDLVREQADKWGRSFTPDGFCLLSIQTPVDGLASVSDGSPRGEGYDVLDALPDAFVQGRCHALLLRRRPVYDRLVSARVQDDLDHTDDALALGLPCRLTPVSAGLEDTEGAGMAEGESWWLECPFVREGSGARGADVAGAGAPASPVLMAPKTTVVIDDPAACGRTGPVARYRVSGAGQDVGGDGHHLKYLVTLA